MTQEDTRAVILEPARGSWDCLVSGTKRQAVVDAEHGSDLRKPTDPCAF